MGSVEPAAPRAALELGCRELAGPRRAARRRASVIDWTVLVGRTVGGSAPTALGTVVQRMLGFDDDWRREHAPGLLHIELVARGRWRSPLGIMMRYHDVDVTHHG